MKKLIQTQRPDSVFIKDFDMFRLERSIPITSCHQYREQCSQLHYKPIYTFTLE